QDLVKFITRIKVGMAERLPFVVAPGTHRRRVLAAPFFQMLPLFTVISAPFRVVWVERRFKVIGHTYYQMDRADT
ncbi:MAG: hypothetical protein DMG32_21590, partial [Acidobacteria bacterium]